MRLRYTAPLLAAVALFAVSAFADHGNNNNPNNNNNNSNSSFQSSIIGSAPNVTIAGVPSAGAAWTVSQSNVSIQPDSQGKWDIQVQLQNLLLASGASTGTVGSVRAVAASVVCGGSGGQVAASTSSAPLDGSGSAQIQTTVALPAVCRAPVVLV